MPENILKRSRIKECKLKDMLIPTSWVCLIEKELKTGTQKNKIHMEDIVINILSLIRVFMVNLENFIIIFIVFL